MRGAPGSEAVRWLTAIAWMAMVALRLDAQNRGVYPLGMSATNSGVTPEPGLTYSNQLLFYARDRAKDNAGDALPIAGRNAVIMDMNTLTWASKRNVTWGARYSAAATLPFAKNNLTSDVRGPISGGAGFADSYYMPAILAWERERIAVRAIYGFLAPTGRFVADADDNVSSGYWTHALSSGQTFYLTENKILTLSTFEMYEFHTTQEGTGVHPGQTFDLDYSLIASLKRAGPVQMQTGVVGYVQRQTTTTTGPETTSSSESDRYAVNAAGFAFSTLFPKRKASVNVKYFKEFKNRSTFQGYSLQVLGVISF